MQKNYEYLLIGNGRLAKHIGNYFSLLGITFGFWYRGIERNLEKSIEKSNKILVLISDSALEPFINKYKKDFPSKIFIHFSGAISLPNAESAHPLMSFSTSLYDLEFYSIIPFITEKGKADFKTIFPELNNPSFVILPQDKAYYHALCTVGGNFTVILWQEFAKQMYKNFKIPKEMLLPYLTKTLRNFLEEENSLTGPFVRGDQKTILKHKLALQGKSIAPLYEAFLSFYLKSNEGKQQ